eukprot:4540546-Prymnesium_polylepis.1
MLTEGDTTIWGVSSRLLRAAVMIQTRHGVCGHVCRRAGRGADACVTQRRERMGGRGNVVDENWYRSSCSCSIRVDEVLQMPRKRYVVITHATHHVDGVRKIAAQSPTRVAGASPNCQDAAFEAVVVR